MKQRAIITLPSCVSLGQLENNVLIVIQQIMRLLVSLQIPSSLFKRFIIMNCHLIGFVVLQNHMGSIF